MENEIWKWLSDHCPVLFMILVIMMITSIITWKTSHWIHRIKATETKCDKVCDKIDNYVIPQLEVLTTTLNNVLVYLKSRDSGLDISFFRSKSPVVLTDIANKILLDFGGKSFIDNNLNRLVSALELQPIKSALDVQNSAPIIIGKFTNSDDFTPIKNKLYNDPAYKTNNAQGQEVSVLLDLMTYIAIMGIYLRDRYLEKHPDLKTG